MKKLNELLINEFELQKENGYREFEYWMAHIIALKNNLNDYDKIILKNNYMRKDRINGLTWYTLFYNNNIDKDSYFSANYCIETSEIKYYDGGKIINGVLHCSQIDRNTFIEGISNKKFIELLEYV